MATRTIDLNCDMGESFGAWTMGQDEAVLPYVSSVNVACGFHAGDPDVMLRTVRAAHARGVAIGAHVSLPDLQGFGRREMKVSADEVYALTAYQVGALAGIARAVGASLNHVKAHGALYNQLARDAALAVADRQVLSVCPYCGVGCQLTYHVKDNAIVRVADPPAKGRALALAMRGMSRIRRGMSGSVMVAGLPVASRTTISFRMRSAR